MALYIFGIGGTGARVIKALTLLMASGVQLSNTRTVVPILIDPDNANGDLTRTLRLLRLYRSLRGYTEQDCNKFFHTEIRPLADVKDQERTNEYHFSLNSGSNRPFRDMIGLSTMEPATKAMARMLFSQANLDADMEVGFKGNPNIGSVALNQFKDSEIFKAFATSFNQDDRIVVIGSIFGGTGAAGLPLLIKNLRHADPALPKSALLRDAPIAAISVLPYFEVQGDATSIDSNTFISKTKAALTYYASNLCRNRSLNALYYIGDKESNTHNGVDGAAGQKNKAHFVELAAAMAIVDFMQLGKEVLAVEGGKAQSPQYFEYGLKEATSEIQFRHLGSRTFSVAGKSLSQYFLFQKFFRDHYKEMPARTAWMNGSDKLTLETLDQRMLSDLEQFNGIFEEWLIEMEQSRTAFRPFRRDVDAKNILNAAIGFEEKTSWNPMEAKGLDRYSKVLSRLEEKLPALGNSERKLFGLFYSATKELTTERLKL